MRHLFLRSLLITPVLALIAFGIYGWQTVLGPTRPHPLSWLLFGVLSGTGYLIQKDQRAGAGSWDWTASSGSPEIVRAQAIAICPSGSLGSNAIARPASLRAASA